MAKSWIDDAWLRDAVDRDGNRIPPTAAMRRAAGADPEKAKKTIPPEHRTARYGKGSRWVVYWNAPDGRRRKAFRNRADAEAFRAGMEDDLRSGRYIDPRGGERTVADAYREWIGTLVNIKESTAAGYESAYRTTIGPKWAGTPLGAIDRSMVTAWVRDLLDGNAPGPLKGPLAASAATQRLFVLTMILDHAVRMRLIPANPASGIRVRATPSTRVRYLTADQIRRTADAAETLVSPHGRRIGSRRDRTMILLLAYTGMRDGELAALRVGDVRYRSRRIHITKTVTLQRDGRLGEGTPKNGKNRRVPIPGFLTRDLHELTDGRPADAYLFANAKGGRIHIGSWVRRIWHPALAAAGIRETPQARVTVHALRHSYASMAIAAGADPKTLQAILGHSSARITLDLYADLWPDRMDQVSDRIAETFVPPSPAMSPKCPPNGPDGGGDPSGTA